MATDQKWPLSHLLISYQSLAGHLWIFWLVFLIWFICKMATLLFNHETFEKIYFCFVYFTSPWERYQIRLIFPNQIKNSGTFGNFGAKLWEVAAKLHSLGGWRLLEEKYSKLYNLSRIWRGFLTNDLEWHLIYRGSWGVKQRLN